MGAVFRVRGLRGSAVDDASNDAILVCSNGKRYQDSYELIVGHQPFTAGQFRLRPGSAETGTVVFAVPDGVRAVAVKWASSSTFGPTFTWKLKQPR